MADTKLNKNNFALRLLKLTGQYYHLLAILLAQLSTSYLGIALGMQLIAQNAGFSPGQLTGTRITYVILVTVGNLFLLGVGARYTRDTAARLGQWKAGKPLAEGQVELRAWRQVNSMAWYYGAGATFVAIVVTFPLLAYQSFGLGATPDQLIYSALACALGAIFSTIASVLLLEFALHPVREVLLPSSFEMQVAGSVGFRLRLKFMITTLALIGFSILAVAPLGYSKTYTVLFEEVGSQQVLTDLRIGFAVSTTIALGLGMLLAFFISESVSAPIRNLIGIFKRVETGDMKARAIITSSDESGELGIHFNQMISSLEELQTNLEKRVEEQTAKLRASNEVGRISSTILDPDVLIARVVNLIAKTFDYYYVAVFLVTENGRWAEIKDATGSAGEVLKARRHRLQVGGNSMVGSAISTHEPQVAMDVGERAVRFNNPLLPNTRSELALPLIVGERVIGALDVQSIREADFQPDDIATLQSLSSQVATSIENARLFREMDEALDELRQANQQYIRSAWTEKLQANKLEYSTKSNLIPTTDDTKDIAVNLSLRDQMIGYIHMQINDEWSQEDQAWVESLATQVAVSLENARLVEESHQSALRERLSASIIQKLWSASSIDGILQTAAREMGRALEASEATIEVRVDD